MFENLTIPGLDAATGGLTIPLWAALAAFGLMAIVIVMALVRTGVDNFMTPLFRVAVFAIGAFAVYAYLDQAREHDRLTERLALDQRNSNLISQVIAPNSILACLDAIAGEPVDTACEKTIFASADGVATASAYIAARIDLLSDVQDFVTHRDPSFEPGTASLRRPIEADRFGIASQILAYRDGCTAENCAFFAALRDTDRIKANLNDRVFEAVLARNMPNWASRGQRLAATPQAPTLQSTNSGSSPVPPGFNLPSSASIPPINIMTNDPPPAPSVTGATPPTGSAPDRTPAQSQARKPLPPPPPRPAPRTQANAPVLLAPPPQSNAAPTLAQ